MTTVMKRRSSPSRGPLSGLARRGKLKYFLPRIGQQAMILDLGCSDNWFKEEAASLGWTRTVGVDLRPPADVVGDVFEWRAIGLEAHSFDAVVAFEVIEHGDFAGVIWDLLKPDGLLFATTPIPRMDRVCRALEAMRLLQHRSSPHSHLTDLRQLAYFDVVERRILWGVSQWAVLRPHVTRT
ncbi:MAG TPA: methyltransferase domain-containing protein [Acidimicrobiales bacterium]|nr:methyltransferase domain-containing protein [Acidimicrobiales bacterium]